MKLSAACLLILLPALLSGQEWWTGLDLKYKLNDRFKLGLENGMRFTDRPHQLNNAFSEIQLRFSILDWIEATPAYRFRYLPRQEHRISQDVTITAFNRKKLPISLRTRYQREYGNEVQNVLRWQLELNYRHSSTLRPHLSVEPFYRLDRTSEFRLLRYTAGLKSGITGFLDLDLFYRKERELNRERPESFTIFGSMLSLDIHKLKKKN